MSFVRLLVDGESNDESEQSNNEQPVRAFSSERRAEVEMLVMGQVQRLIKPALEDIISRLVRDGTELATDWLRTSLNWNSENEMLTSGPRSLKLQFVNKIPLVIYTRNKIVGENSAPIEIALVDCLTGQVVKFGPVASAKVEIVVLQVDFGGNNGDDWTVEEFESKIVKEMHGRKSILVGNELNLNEGIALGSEVSFTHNSNWVKICKFRLGAKVVGHFDGIRVKEAKTEPFTLKDFRATYRKKHDSLSLNDEVSKLKKIGKNGPFHKRLIEANVKTVQEFLVQLSINPQRLREMHTGGDKMWAVIVGHAWECKIDETVYVYPSPSSGQKTRVVFNVVGQVLGLHLQNQYVPINEISQTQKAEAHKSVVSAFEHWEDVVSYADESELINGSSHLFNDNDPSNSTWLEAPSNVVDHDDVASTSSPLCLSSINLEEIWSAIESRTAIESRRKWKVVSGVLKFVTNKRTVAIGGTHIQKKMKCF